jgi:hypothetical protein
VTGVRRPVLSGAAWLEAAFQLVVLALLAVTVRRLAADVERPLGDSAEPIGVLKGAARDVRRRPAKVPAWDDVGTGTPLFQRDSLFTGPGSAATVALTGGGHLDIGERSLVVLEAPHRDDPVKTAKVDVVQGVVAAAAGADTGIDLQLPGGKGNLSLSASGEASVERDADGGVEVRVLKGGAAVQSAGSARRLGAHEGLLVGASGQLGAVTPLPFALSQPVAGASAVAGKPVTFTWDKAPAGPGLKLQVASDCGFHLVLAERDVADLNGTTLPLPVGTRCWRLTAPAGRSEPRALEALEIRAPTLIAPLDGATVIAGAGGGADVVLVWQQVPGAARYRVDWSAGMSAGGQAIGSGIMAERGPLSVHLPGTGVFSWRVTALYEVAGAPAESRSALVASLPAATAPASASSLSRTVRVAQAERAEAPVIVGPEPGAVIGEDGATPDVTFRWRAGVGGTGDAGSAAYLVEVAPGGDFGGRVTSLMATTPPVSWQPRTPGRYSWRVTVLGAEGRRLATAGPQELTVASGRAEPLAPAGKARLSMRQPVVFSWRPAWDAEAHVFELALAEAPDAPVMTRTLRGATYTWKGPHPGHYVWRVRPVRGGQADAEGAGGSFEVKTAAPPPPALNANYELEVR